MPELIKLLEETKDKQATEAELADQRISFAYGNADERSGITKDTVRASATRTKLFA
jgi:hypothetical protein